ncbi:ABC transporter substrate-binding protein [Solirubrum puertoriconensis]|uniref:Iron ABC transporter n=1 Tax=Solirubrum puertoriconensis TaxID=1751427 RepID=A0A9X0L6A6_SOLP1|nr:helical backbone metal receptor [Solirubrum puertoriconensis]KUG09608.1 iron ABC transporter [Solirubrum puertoriconensis]
MLQLPLVQTPLTVTDQINRRVVVPFPPQRIVSLVPSQTELLYDLGLGERVVGVTKFCIHPAGARKQAQVIGGTKNFNFEHIAELKPDLIIGNKEENYQEGIEQLTADYPVWMSDIFTLGDSLRMMRQVGLITGTQARAERLAEEIGSSLQALPAVAEPLSAAYFIWRKPYMVAAAGTFIDDMLPRAGFRNVFSALGRYPEVSAEQLATAAPQVILLSSEPYPFQEKHVEEFRAICPNAQVLVVDGELFSWYGSRLRHTTAYFEQLQNEVARTF